MSGGQGERNHTGPEVATWAPVQAMLETVLVHLLSLLYTKGSNLEESSTPLVWHEEPLVILLDLGRQGFPSQSWHTCV